MAQQPFNSDDLEFSEAELSSPLRNPAIGRKTIAQIIEDGPTDRISSKKAVSYHLTKQDSSQSQIALCGWCIFATQLTNAQSSIR